MYLTNPFHGITEFPVHSGHVYELFVHVYVCAHVCICLCVCVCVCVMGWLCDMYDLSYTCTTSLASAVVAVV